MKAIIKLFLLLTFVGIGKQSSVAQSFYYTSGHPAYHHMDRFDIQYGDQFFHSALRKYSRKEILNSVQANERLGSQFELSRQYIFKDNEWMIKTDSTLEMIIIDKEYDNSGVFYSVQEQAKSTYKKKENRKPF